MCYQATQPVLLDQDIYASSAATGKNELALVLTLAPHTSSSVSSSPQLALVLIYLILSV